MGDGDNEHGAGTICRIDVSDYKDGSSFFRVTIQWRAVIDPVDFPLSNLSIIHRGPVSLNPSKAWLAGKASRVGFGNFLKFVWVSEEPSVQFPKGFLPGLLHMNPTNGKVADAVSADGGLGPG
jgi:hypothetical protein